MTSKRSVLYIEDEFADSQKVFLMLSGDYFVMCVNTGTEGVRIARDAEPDCVLLDYQLPDIDGLTVLAELTSDAEQPRLPVIMLSGYDDDKRKSDAMKQGAQAYLSKENLTKEALLRAIENAIEACSPGEGLS
jgi:CheY-like chemotaxis protein